MAQKFKDEAGNIWEMGPDGQPRLVAPAPADPTKNPMVDPRLAPQTTKAQNEAAASQYAPQIAGADATIKQADAGVAGTVANAEAAKAVADAQKAQAELAKLKLEQSAADPKSPAYKALQEQIDRVSQLYRQSIQGGMPNPIWGHIPTSDNSAFSSAAQGLVNPYMQAFRIPGVGSQSDTELKQFIEGNVPQPTDTDAQIQEKLGNIQRQLDARNPQQPPAAPAPDQIGLAQGHTRSEVDPVLKAVGLQVGKMLSNGTPGRDIEKFLRDNNVDPASTDLVAKLHYRMTPEFKRWQRANPGAPYPVGASFYTREIPMSDTRALMNSVSQSAPGAFAAAGANALAGGRLDSLTNNPANAQIGMDLLRGQHPVASFAGDLAGQAGLEATLGRIPGAQGLLATRMGRRGADALYGAYSGSGENNDDPLNGALTGALTNTGFGMFGRSAQRGIGRVATGVKNAHLQYLDRLGVPLTVGQIGRGSENIVGRTIGGIEERLAGMPIADAIIGTARKRGDAGFNRAAFKQIGGSGATGAQGLDEARGLVDKAYNFLDPVSLPLDAQYAGSQAVVRASIPDLPAFGDELTKGLNLLDKQAKNGALTGRDWQSGIRSVRANRSSIAGQPFADHAANALSAVEQNLMGLAQRQGPAETAANLANANTLHGQVQTLASALDNGPAQMADEMFSPRRLDDAARAGARNFGGRMNSLTGGRPFYDLTTAGKAVMPNLTPDSGTAGRSLLYSALLGGGVGGIGGYADADQGQRGNGGVSGALKGLAVAGALTAPYSKTGQKLIQRALLGQRPHDIEKLGNYLINHPRFAGMFGSALGRDYVYQPEINIGQ